MELTLNFKTGALLITIAFALILPWAAFSQQSIMQRGDLAIFEQRIVHDVVVADGNLIVKGRVLGSVFLVNGDALVAPYAVVEGNLTVLRGSLWVSSAARVDGEINILSGKAHIEEGARVSAQVRALEEVSSLNPEKLALISRYILFSRKVPSRTYRLENLDQFDLSALRLKAVRDQSAVNLDLFELGKARLSLEEVEDSVDLTYRGRDLRARVCVIRFDSQSAAEKFWMRLRTDYEEKTSYTVHNSLGDGAHWYFRYRGASYCLWHKDQTFQAVMVWQHDDDPGHDEWDEIENLRDHT
jgi:hypothetical protein